MYTANGYVIYRAKAALYRWFYDLIQYTTRLSAIRTSLE